MVIQSQRKYHLGAPVSCSSNLFNDKYDCIILVSSHMEAVKKVSTQLERRLIQHFEVDLNASKDGCVIRIDESPGKVVYSPTGPINRDYDDVRRFGDAAVKGMKRAIASGSKRPLLAVIADSRFKNCVLVSILGALEALYLPLQYREIRPEATMKIEQLGVFGEDLKEIQQIVELASALESGRYVTRDLAGADPERMAPPKFAQFVQDLFVDSAVKVQVIADRQVFEKEYPLFAAVDRAANSVERHAGRIIYLTYEGQGPIKTTLMPCGKGITYDTGGADIKAGGIMAGMDRDKCGAAAVVGLFQALRHIQPKGIKAIGGLAVARNSVGEECYVADEIIVSRGGKVVRIGNTDAEGRLVMADVLARLKEIALTEVNPHLLTIATLTGHAWTAMGPYTAVMDNGPAHHQGFARELQLLGQELGDMFEVSHLRREDYNFNKANVDGQDLLQANNKTSSSNQRGHQSPAAFMIEASGLDQHGIDSTQPLKYSHLDIAGSAGDYPDHPTAAPVLGLTAIFLGNEFQ